MHFSKLLVSLGINQQDLFNSQFEKNCFDGIQCKICANFYRLTKHDNVQREASKDSKEATGHGVLFIISLQICNFTTMRTLWNAFYSKYCEIFQFFFYGAAFKEIVFCGTSLGDYWSEMRLILLAIYVLALP